MRKPDYRWFHDKNENIQDLEGEWRMKKKIVAMILVLACVTGIYAPENAWEAPVTVEASTQKGKKTIHTKSIQCCKESVWG